MNCERTIKHSVVCFALTLIYLLGVVLPAAPQEDTKSSPKKWRPKDGLYAEPGEDFDRRCKEEYGDIVVELAEKLVGGNEWGCKVTKLTDTAPGTIELNVTCYDPNVGEDKESAESMTLTRIDETSISVRTMDGGSFKTWRANYCPDKAQRSYIQQKARERVEAKRKASEEDAIRKLWHPQDGIYATSSADFEDRCLKGGDATIELTGKSVSRGVETCNVISSKLKPEDFQLFVSCRQELNSPRSSEKHDEAGAMPTPSHSETVLLKRSPAKEANVVLMQMSKNGEFSTPLERMSYCGPEAQKLYAQQKAKK